jgi:hypothetical protein
MTLTLNINASVGLILLTYRNPFTSDFYVPGLACCLGLDKTFAFFAQRDRLKGTTAFLGGIVTVLLGWPIVGMIIELYGFVALFGGFLPLVISFLRQVIPLCHSLRYLPFQCQWARFLLLSCKPSDLFQVVAIKLFYYTEAVFFLFNTLH